MEKSKDIELQQPLQPVPAPTNVPTQTYTQKASHVNENRPRWDNPVDHLCALFSYVFSFGVVWRFPYLMYRHGGVVFLVPYVVMLLAIGFPLLLLESYIGQFSSNGVLTCWGMFPMFKGVGVAMVFICALTTTYYAIINAWVVNYFFLSWQQTLPWSSCDNQWNTERCHDGNSVPGPHNNNDSYDGQNLTHTGSYGVNDYYNDNYNGDDNYRRVLAAEEFWFHKVLRITDGFEDLSAPRWEIVLALISVWIVVCAVLAFGPKAYGKMAYITCVLPAPLLLILLIRAVTLPGASTGLKFMIYPDWFQLSRKSTWKASIGQVFYSMGLGWGPIITLSSYSKLRNDCVRDIFLMPVLNFIFSILCSIFVFGITGFVAHNQNLAVSEVVTPGVSMFVPMATAFANMPVGALWSAIFYFMLLTISIGSLFAFVETIVTSILDLNRSFQRLRPFIVCGTCVVLFLLGLPFTCGSGIYWFTLVDIALHQNILLIPLAELFCVVAMYGLFSHIFTNASLLRYKDDLRLMLGGKGCHFVPWVICWPVWSVMWAFITPALLAFAWFDNTIEFAFIQSFGYGTYMFPQWSRVVCQLIAELSVSLMLFTPIVMVLVRCCCRGGKLSKALEYMIKPTRFWGPALPKYRQRMGRYVPENRFEVDPWNTPESTIYQPTLA